MDSHTTFLHFYNSNKLTNLVKEFFFRLILLKSFTFFNLPNTTIRNQTDKFDSQVE